jgi:hypothetical protein
MTTLQIQPLIALLLFCFSTCNALSCYNGTGQDVTTVLKYGESAMCARWNEPVCKVEGCDVNSNPQNATWVWRYWATTDGTCLTIQERNTPPWQNVRDVYCCRQELCNSVINSTATIIPGLYIFGIMFAVMYHRNRYE